MFKNILLLLLICSPLVLKAQKSGKFTFIERAMLQISDSSTSSVQDIANYVNLKFLTQKQKARAIFFWIAKNIDYDCDNMFVNSSSKSEDILKVRKGVCRDYVNLYSAIASKVGIRTYVVTGYTKKYSQVLYSPHAWCALMIDSIWYLTDPTWGAGYIKDFHFVKEIDNNNFMVRPDRFIKTHIPFDPLWQFSNYPITKREFQKGKSKSPKRVFFNFVDTLKVFDNQNEIQRLTNTSIRIKSNGIASYLDLDNLNHLNFSIKEYYDKLNEGQYNLALKYYSEGVHLLNEYIDYQNKYYLPYKSDSEIKKMLDNIEGELNLALSHLEQVKNSSSTLKINKNNLLKSIRRVNDNLKIIKEKLDKYLEIARIYRKSLSHNIKIKPNHK
ncbi:transglutaminase superfamily protein [Ancylomarina subtilis]|uniref:Transglutaminase superfamily protein n=1 Tax=Ancylomarina subtilis TaxID=1639035 RepID=A0A4Q7VKS8_9BACT|nr:transglutaminase domain-containing protein [Ancylomarina subtilis]RZT96833.1 transglutaminase superfamily protein [Ancylomarina subtilis]